MKQFFKEKNNGCTLLFIKLSQARYYSPPSILKQKSSKIFPFSLILTAQDEHFRPVRLDSSANHPPSVLGGAGGG